MFSKRVSEITILIFGKCSKIDENGHEWVRHGSPQAHIRRGRCYKLSDASGRLPDAPWGRFKAILIDFGSKSGRQNLPEKNPYISLLWGTPSGARTEGTTVLRGILGYTFGESCEHTLGSSLGASWGIS